PDGPQRDAEPPGSRLPAALRLLLPVLPLVLHPPPLRRARRLGGTAGARDDGQLGQSLAQALQGLRAIPGLAPALRGGDGELGGPVGEAHPALRLGPVLSARPTGGEERLVALGEERLLRQRQRPPG